MGIEATIAGMAGAGKVKPPGISQTGADFMGLLKEGYLPGAEKLVGSAEELLPRYSKLYQDQAKTSAPGVLDTLKTANPELAALMAKITSAAGEGPLNYGEGFPKGLLRLTNQYSRAGQAARGMGYGPADVYGETGDAAKLSADLTDRNRNFATSAAGLSYSTQTDPFLRLLGGILGAGDNKLLSPAGSTSLLLAPYAARANANQSSAANQSHLYETGSQGLDSALSKI